MYLSDVVGGGLKSIQRGVLSNSDSNTLNVTISAVNLAKSIVIGSVKSTNTGLGGATLRLTSGTNLQIAFGPGGSGAPVSVEWQVVEYA